MKSCLLLLPLLLLLSSNLTLAQEVPTVSCGYAFRDLIFNCAHPTASTVSRCCPSIRLYNNAFCWCEPVGQNLASLLATNVYSLALRADVCNVSQPLRPSFPSGRGSPPTLNTCPRDFTSLPVDSDSEGCGNPQELRRRRTATLGTFDGLTLNGIEEKDMVSFKNTVKNIFANDSSFASIGLWGTMGDNDQILDFLWTRQTALGSPLAWAPENVRTELRDRFWREATVSYALDYADPEGFLSSRYVFVVFEECSHRIIDVYVAEPGVVSSISTQFYYPAEPTNAVSLYNVEAQEVCQRIMNGCGDLTPYDSMAECMTFMMRLKAEGRVMCNRYGGEQTPVNALFGDTLACRYQYALAIPADPKRYCPKVGEIGRGTCVENLCKDDEYEDIFADDINPRYSQSSTFTCNTVSGECEEIWPVGGDEFGDATN
eukprot:GFKZ01001126.1.p1 GENE.GFKZ01001126.1~~GFKZ01001126.1.p1  ORF type:complete len:430 (+),score=32.55 GFKZ01001126.1:277-1566(+)